MDDLSQIILDTGEATFTLISSVVDGLNIIIPYISQELSTTIGMASSTVSFGIVDLINTIFGFYSDEWPTIEAYLHNIDNSVNAFSVSAVNNINTVLSQFESLITSLLNNFETRLAQIDTSVTARYDERMFTIYGDVANLSKAINTPPDYLEGIIQDARSFAMAIACSTGLSYYTFLANWDSGVQNLLILIANSVNLYRQNPQRIKNDVESSLIKPIFDMNVIRARNISDSIRAFNRDIGNIESSLADLITNLAENNRDIDNIYNVEIPAAIKQIQDNFSAWEKDTYKFNKQAQDDDILRLWESINKLVSGINDVIAGLSYGGDLLLRIDSLYDNERLDQEEKISEVATRRFKALIPDWQSVVEERVG
jgi:hypothetical protein